MKKEWGSTDAGTTVLEKRSLRCERWNKGYSIAGAQQGTLTGNKESKKKSHLSRSKGGRNNLAYRTLRKERNDAGVRAGKVLTEESHPRRRSGAGHLGNLEWGGQN